MQLPRRIPHRDYPDTMVSVRVLLMQFSLVAIGMVCATVLAIYDHWVMAWAVLVIALSVGLNVTLVGERRP